MVGEKGAEGVAAEPQRDLRFAIIGAGMSGILSAIKLSEAGLDDFTVYEKAERIGGPCVGLPASFRPLLDGTPTITPRHAKNAA